MGSPLGPTLANIFLCHCKTTWLKNCPKSFKPVYYKRYVDDIFVLFEKLEQVSRLNFRLKLKKTIPFLLLMLRFIEKKIKCFQKRYV